MSIHGFMAIHFLARDVIRMAIRWTPVDLDTREGGWIHGKERGEMGCTQQKGYERAIRSHDARLHHQGLVSLRRVYSKRITRPPWLPSRGREEWEEGGRVVVRVEMDGKPHGGVSGLPLGCSKLCLRPGLARNVPDMARRGRGRVLAYRARREFQILSNPYADGFDRAIG